MIRFCFVFIAIAFIGMLACIAPAEENVVNGATIRGEVIEATAEQNPIEGVEVKIVSLDGKEWTVKTNAKGEYKHTGLPAGRYTVSVSKRGYHPRIGRSKVVAAGGEVFDRIKMRKTDNFENRFVEGLLQHVAERIGKRYNLEASNVEELHKSILQAFSTVMEQEEKGGTDFANLEKYGSIGVILTLLSHPDCKAAFANYLTETQLQDYLDFTKARQLRVQHSVVQFATAYLNQTLSLTADQRENIAKLLLDAIIEKQGLSLMNTMSGQLQRAVVNLIHNELNISLDNILNQPQSIIWQQMINQKDRFFKDLVEMEVLDVNEPDKDQNGQKGVDTKHNDLLNKIDEQPKKSQSWILAEATLNAHTKSIGPLNENASKRLETATNGVVQQYIEIQNTDTDVEFKFDAELGALVQSFLQQNIPQEQAIEKLESIKKRWDEHELYKITNHPLYQQAIKDVLPEDAYLQYKARQTERENFRMQASQDFILAFIDMIVLLDDEQRKQLKTSTAQLTLPSISEVKLSLMFAEFFIRMDNEILSPWQQSVFKGVK